MAIVLRSTKGATLTHSEMDNNFSELSNRVLLGATQVQALIDSSYVQNRAASAFLDSAETINLIDSAYVTNIVQTAPTRPVLEAFNLADSATFNTFAAGSIIFLNDGNQGEPCIAVKDSAAGNFRIIAFGAIPQQQQGGGGF